MAQVLIRDLQEKTLNALKKRAKSNERSLEAEIRHTLNELAEEPVEDRTEIARRFREKFNLKFKGDVVEMIREDRDR